MRRRTASSSIFTAAAVAATFASGAVAQEPAAPSIAPGASAAPAEEMSLLSIERGTALQPGRYVDRSLGRDIRFELGDGWINEVSIPGAGFAIVRDEPGAPYFDISPFNGEVFPADCPDMSVDEEGAAFFGGITSIEPTAARFVEHVSSMPELTVTEAVPVEVAGFEGLQLDVTGVDVDDHCVPPWAWLMVLPEVGDYHLAEGVVARIIALDADSQVLVSFMEIMPDGDVQGFYDQGMAILDTLEVGPLAP
jgi:hypothetical protein